jgi:hypothetical protein
MTPKQKPVTYPDFIVLLARQRSGTNPVRSVLGSHPDIFCFNEVFKFADKDSEHLLLREPNFFTFLEKHTAGDLRNAWPDRHERIFVDFLEYLRCFTDKRYVVIDVKYNMTHFLTKQWTPMMSPYLFDLIVDYGLKVFNLTRRNYLRHFLSGHKAWQSGEYTVSAQDSNYEDRPTSLAVGWVLEQLDACYAEDRLIKKRFESYPHFRSYEYANVFPGGDEPISDGFLRWFSRWLGISNEFDIVPEYKKQSFLPLAETVENFDEIAQALSGTRFAYCLEDEPAYKAADGGS